MRADAGTKRKSVRIAPDPQVLKYVETVGEMSDQDRFQGWWQPDEYEGAKASARSLCRKMRLIGGINGCLSDAYDRAGMIAASGLHLEAVDAAQELTPNDSLVDWCRTNQTRGLERWTCKSYGTSRGKDASEVKHAVLLEQARQFLANERNEEEIARVAEQASRKARTFAALLGHADAAAAQSPEPKLDLSNRSPTTRKAFKPACDLLPSQDPISDESSGEEQAPPPIFISIETLT